MTPQNKSYFQISIVNPAVSCRHRALPGHSEFKKIYKCNLTKFYWCLFLRVQISNALVQLMAEWRQATSHDLNQCWPWSMMHQWATMTWSQSEWFFFVHIPESHNPSGAARAQAGKPHLLGLWVSQWVFRGWVITVMWWIFFISISMAQCKTAVNPVC